MGLTKKIAFDENSMPPKDQIWYRGEGKFYEYKDGKWVLAYDLAGTPSQEELESVANVIEEKTGKTLENKSLPGILQGIIDLIPEAPTPQVQADFTVTDPDSPAYVKVAEISGIEYNELTSISDEKFNELTNQIIIRCNGELMQLLTLPESLLDILGDSYLNSTRPTCVFACYFNYDYGQAGYTSVEGTFLMIANTGDGYTCYLADI